jgi:hypothetical protein
MNSFFKKQFEHLEDIQKLNEIKTHAIYENIEVLKYILDIYNMNVVEYNSLLCDLLSFENLSIEVFKIVIEKNDITSLNISDKIFDTLLDNKKYDIIEYFRNSGFKIELISHFEKILINDNHVKLFCEKVKCFKYEIISDDTLYVLMFNKNFSLLLYLMERYNISKNEILKVMDDSIKTHEILIGLNKIGFSIVNFPLLNLQTIEQMDVKKDEAFLYLKKYNDNYILLHFLKKFNFKLQELSLKNINSEVLEYIFNVFSFTVSLELLEEINLKNINEELIIKIIRKNLEIFPFYLQNIWEKIIDLKYIDVQKFIIKNINLDFSQLEIIDNEYMYELIIDKYDDFPFNLTLFKKICYRVSCKKFFLRFNFIAEVRECIKKYDTKLFDEFSSNSECVICYEKTETFCFCSNDKKQHYICGKCCDSLNSRKCPMCRERWGLI